VFPFPHLKIESDPVTENVVYSNLLEFRKMCIVSNTVILKVVLILNKSAEYQQILKVSNPNVNIFFLSITLMDYFNLWTRAPLCFARPIIFDFRKARKSS
jgi:hypothetical protein